MSPASSDAVHTKVLVNLDIDLLPILKSCGAHDRIGNPSSIPFAAQEPSETRLVETIISDSKPVRRKLVRSWHFCQNLAEVGQRRCRGVGTFRGPQQRAARRGDGQARVGTPVYVGSARTIRAAER